jgi:hypothetical protein
MPIPLNSSQIINGNLFAPGLYVSGSGSYIQDLSGSFTGSFTGSGIISTASYALNSDKLDGIDGNAFATTGSNLFRGDQQISGSIFMTGSLQTVRYIDFVRATGSAVPVASSGRVYYDLDESAVTVFTEIANTQLYLGQQQQYLVKNQSGVTINKGELVAYAGTLGSSGRILVSKADQTIVPSSTYVLGVAGNTMNTGDDGFIFSFGKIKGVQTNGANYTQSWSDGDLLYPHPTIPGGFTNTQPSQSKWKLITAKVIKADASNGIIFVRLVPGNNIGELDNIDDINSTPGDLIVKTGFDSGWINTKQLTGSYGVSGSLNIRSNNQLPFTITSVTASESSSHATFRQFISSSTGTIQGNVGFGLKNEFYGTINNGYPFPYGATEYTVLNTTVRNTKKTEYIGGGGLFEKINEYNRHSYKEFSRLNSNFTHRTYVFSGTTNGAENIYLGTADIPSEQFIEMPVWESWNFTLRVIARKTDGLASDSFFINGFCDNYNIGTINGQSVQSYEIGSPTVTPNLNAVVIFDQNGGANNYFRIQCASIDAGTVTWVAYLDVVANYASASARPDGPGGI